MNTQGIDLLEVVLKSDLQIPLTEPEEEFLKSVDKDTKEATLLLINNEAFLDDIKSLSQTIIRKASELPQEQQDYIKSKCQKKIQELEYPSLKLKSFEASNKKLKKC